MTKDKEEKLPKIRRKSKLNDKNTNISKWEKLLDKIKRLVEKAVYPTDCRCVVCNSEIASGSKYCLCSECFKSFPFNNGRICVRCGSPIDNEACYCLECQNHTKAFDFVRSSLKYSGEAKKLIIDFKFYNNRWLANVFADMLYDTYLANHLDAQVVIPVPITYARQKGRGYNQAYLLAKALSEKLQLPLVTDAVIKVKDNKQQASLSLKERRNNVVGVYELLNRESVQGKKVLVVDDILTSGSTMSEVCRKLKIAGATNVYGLVIASPEYKVPNESNIDNLDFEIIND